MIKVLYIEDDPAHVELTNRSLESSGTKFDLQAASTINDAFVLLRDNGFDVILSDYRLPDGSGMDVISRALEQKVSAAIVLITNQEDINIAISALKAGAVDYVVKESDYLDRLPIVLNNAFKHSQLEKQKKALHEAENKYRNIFEHAVEGIFQSSLEGRYMSVNPAMARIYGYTSPDDMISNVASIDKQIYTRTESR
ncbi:MAG TPA: response regulator, partial [Anaerolineales bacterium]|nr:response regulator [Anaerolineales bacterium]